MNDVFRLMATGSGGVASTAIQDSGRDWLKTARSRPTSQRISPMCLIDSGTEMPLTLHDNLKRWMH